MSNPNPIVGRDGECMHTGDLHVQVWLCERGYKVVPVDRYGVPEDGRNRNRGDGWAGRGDTVLEALSSLLDSYPGVVNRTWPDNSDEDDEA